MSEQGKKGFFKSGAFYLILVWLAMGIGLHLLVSAGDLPGKIEHACEGWVDDAKAAGIEINEAGGGHGGGHGGACQMLADSPGAPKYRLAAALLPLTHGMALAWAWNIPNFLIFITLLAYFAKGPLAESLKTRRAELEKAIAEAKKAKEDAEAKLVDYEDRIKNLDREIEAVRADVRAQADAEMKRIVESAENLAKRIKNEANFAAKQELLMAEYRLREEAARLAVEVAESVIKKVISDEDRDRILDEYLSKVREQA